MDNCFPDLEYLYIYDFESEEDIAISDNNFQKLKICRILWNQKHRTI
jgi:hypothetical protein